MQHLAPFAVVITFILFLTASALAGIVADFKKRKVALEVIRASIERGQPAEPGLVDRLLEPEVRRAALNPLYVTVAGIVIAAAGIGVAILAFFVAQVAPDALYPVLGAGIAVVCLGAGLVLAARVAERKMAGAAHGA
jgi:hypothetical protein